MSKNLQEVGELSMKMSGQRAVCQRNQHVQRPCGRVWVACSRSREECFTRWLMKCEDRLNSRDKIRELAGIKSWCICKSEQGLSFYSERLLLSHFLRRRTMARFFLFTGLTTFAVIVMHCRRAGGKQG